MIVGIETGGTTVVCAAARGPSDEQGSAEPARTPPHITDLETLPTTSPQDTLGRVRSFIARHDARAGVEAVGVAAFGPVDVDPSSPRYGTIGATPKEGWQGVRLLDAVRSAADCPVAIDTDATAAAVAEHRWGAGRGLQHCVYVTVGTGIGVGAIVAGAPLHGTGHPEAGHLTVRRHPHDAFEGTCRLHGDCLEGLASGPAIAARWGRPGERLGDRRRAAVEMEAFYLAQLTTAVVYLLAPGRIVVGGGVAGAPGLLPALRRRTASVVAGALEDHPVADPSSAFLVPAYLAGRSGVVGALTLASDVASDQRGRPRPR